MPFQITVREPLANSSNNLYSAEPPIGSIIAWFPRLYSGLNTGIDVADRIQLPLNWCRCDGRDLTLDPLTKDSPLINAGYKRIPNLTDDRFIMGSSLLGSVGGTNDSSHTHTYKHYHPLSFSSTTSVAGTHTHSYNNWPNESGHTFEFEPGPGATWNATETGQTTGPSGAHSHTFSDNTITEGLGDVMDDASNPVTSNTNMTENRPRFLSVIFVMRVK